MSFNYSWCNFTRVILFLNHWILLDLMLEKELDVMTLMIFILQNSRLSHTLKLVTYSLLSLYNNSFGTREMNEMKMNKNNNFKIFFKQILVTKLVVA